MKSLCFVEIDVPDFANPSPEEISTYRFAKPVDYLPSDVTCIPSIAGISFTPSTISLGQNLGERATLTVVFQDHRHIMNEESFSSGTFWGKWRARYGTRLRGRAIRWIVGLEGQNLAEMETRHFVIESTEGPTPDGIYRIVAKDVLKLADNDRAQAPILSNGFLVAGINNVVTAATLSPSGIGNSEYPASGYVAIGGEEICAFTRSGDALTLTRGQLGTTAAEHDAQDRVQLVLRYDSDDPADIISDLLQTYAGVDSSYIPLASWQNETGSFLQRVYTATIAEPTGVNKLISELIEQAALAMWWDDLNQSIRLQVLRPVATNAATFNEDNTLEGSLKWKEQPGKRVSQVWTYFGQRNPLRPVDEPDNYRSNAITVNLEAEEEYGGAVIKKIFSRWIPAFGRSVATRLNDLILGRFVDAPRQFTYETFRYGQETPMLGTGYQLGSWTFQDEAGVEVLAPIQVTRLNPMEDRFVIESEEMLFDQSNIGDLTDRTVIIDSNVNDVNLREIHDSLYPEVTGTESPQVTLTCIVEEGVEVGASTAANPAFDVGEWPTGIDIILQVAGRIQGKGGDGGGELAAGKRGGPALRTFVPITIDYAEGQIWGGAGGGAGHSAGFVEEGQPTLGGGGGGAGNIPGSGSNGGTAGTQEAGGEGSSSTATFGGTGADGGDPGEYGYPVVGIFFGVGDIPGGMAGIALQGVDLCTITSPEGSLIGMETNSMIRDVNSSFFGGAFSSQDDTHTFNYPSSIEVGDLLLMFVTCHRLETSNNDTGSINTPSGWAQLYHVTGPGDIRRGACYYRTATGAEGATGVITSTNNFEWSTVVYSIREHTGNPEAATATGTSSSPNPPLLTPSWGSDDNLWFVACHDNFADLLEEDENTPSTLPTNYTAALGLAWTTTGHRRLTAASDNPGNFTLGGSGNWVAATVAVRAA